MTQHKGYKKDPDAIWNAIWKLPIGADPQPLDRVIKLHMVDDLRFLDCISYRLCLDFAAKAGWESFVCIYCKFFAQAKDYRPPDD